MLKTTFRFLMYDKAKTIGALFGVVIANFLIGQQTGIFVFLTNSMASLVKNTQTDLWVVDSKTLNVNALGFVDTRIGHMVESIEGVQKAHPYLLAGGSAKFKNGQSFGVLLIGSESPNYVGGPWNLMQGKPSDLLQEYAVTTEWFDRKNMGNSQLGDDFEINGKKVKIALQTKGARGFGAVYTFTTLERARFLSKSSPNKVSAFLVKIKPGSDPIKVRDEINKKVYGVKAWLPDEFASQTIKTVLGSSGIAISIGTMIVFAFISGFVIIGLTLYSAAVDRLKDYATIKAIGASNGFIRKLILLQAFIISLIGFGISSVLLEGFRSGIANAGTLFSYTLEMRIAFFITTLVIALGGSLFAIRRITSVEPASVFRT